MRYLSLAFVLLCALPAFAFDNGQYEDVNPAIRQWFKDLKNPSSGIPCCDMADGHRINYEPRADNHYWVRIEGKWRQVPFESVIRNAGNPVHEAIVWYTLQGQDDDGVVGVYIRCFVPGDGV